MKLKKTVIILAALLSFSAAAPADALTNQMIKEHIVAANKGNHADLTRLTSDAKNGDANAQTELGLFYVENKNYAKAIYWFKKAANHGYAQAEDGLAVAYYKGLGVPQNYTKAAYWYGKAAQQGDIAAEYTLGLAYHEGQGVPQNWRKSIYWFRKAANQGLPQAENALGLIYYKGIGVFKDNKKAIFWWKKAAAQGGEYGEQAQKGINIIDNGDS